MTKAQIVGWAHSRFGKSGTPDVEGLLAEVIAPALDHADVPARDIDAIFVGSLNNGLSSQDFIGALPGMILPELAQTPAVRLENACATGSAALYAALDHIEAGRGRIALVLGVEKMTAIPTSEIGEILLGACYRPEESDVQGGFAGIFGKIADGYFQRYGDKSEELAMIASKNHANGVGNPYAHMQKAFSVEDCNRVSDRNPYVAPPLRRTDCSLVSDGAAALVVAHENIARDLRRAIRFRATTHANDVLALSRRDPHAFDGVRRAWAGSLETAGMISSRPMIASPSPSFCNTRRWAWPHRARAGR